MLQPVRRALISVSDKTGLTELARALAARGVEMLSTGGTARLLRAAGLPVREVADYTGFPEMMDGRVKTLHPKIHGGLLGAAASTMRPWPSTRSRPSICSSSISIRLPDRRARPRCSYEEGIENIDIGGPAMVRAAAKNHEFVTVVVDPLDYPRLLAELTAHQGHDDVRTARRAGRQGLRAHRAATTRRSRNCCMQQHRMAAGELSADTAAGV